MTTAFGDGPLGQAGEQQRRLEVLRGIADHQVARLVDGRFEWDAWLVHAARHGRYGFINTLLIQAQTPSATDVRSYDAWQKRGRQVRPGETGIRIISTRGRPRTVFDIEQTDGEVTEKRELTPAVGLRSLTQLAADLDLYIDRGQGWTYLGQPGRRIQIHPELDDLTAASLLAHQLAHATKLGGHIDTIGAGSVLCHGVRRVIADSVAYLVLAELGLEVSHLSFPSPQQWTGRDVRTDSAAAARAVGEQIVRTSSKLQRRLLGGVPTPPVTTESHTRSLTRPPQPAGKKASSTRKPAPHAREKTPGARRPTDVSTSQLRAALADAHQFYMRNLPGSWGARYLANRGFTPATQQQWELGLAPRSQDALLRHLRGLGHQDQTLIEAGLVKQGDGKNPFDLLRDRVLCPLRNRDGEVIGFIGRRRDEAQGPKYLNTPETPLFRKRDVLFGLYESRAQLRSMARPLLVEGPLDAIAVNATMSETYAAVAPCGTAITAAHIDVLEGHSNMDQTGLVIALDGDSAGQTAAIRAWRTLNHVPGPVEAAVLPQNRDPADLLSRARRSDVQESLLSVVPLADLVVDERIQRFGGELEFVESRLSAARAAAVVIAELPPDQIARQVIRVAARTDMEPAEVSTLVASAISPDPPPELSPTADDVVLPPSPKPEQQNSGVHGTSRRTPSQRPDTHRRTA